MKAKGALLVVAGCLALAPAASAQALQPGEILAYDQGTDTIHRVDPTSGATTTFFTDPAMFIGGMAIERNGNVLIVDRNSETIFRIVPGQPPAPVYTEPDGESMPEIAIDASGGILFSFFEGVNGTSSVKRIPPGSAQAQVFGTDPALGPGGDFSTIDGLAVTNDGVVLAVDEDDSTPGSPGSGGIWRFPLNGGAGVGFFDSRFNDPHDAEIGANGEVFMVDAGFPDGPGDGGVFQLIPGGGLQVIASSATGADWIDPRGIARDLEGRLLIGDRNTANIHRFKPGEAPQLFANVDTDLIAVVPPLCDGSHARVYGDPAANTLFASLSDDVIAGLAGNDEIKARAGDDTVCGAEGNDRLRGGAGGKGRDRLRGRSGNDIIRGGPGFDRCFGGKGKDRFTGCESESG